MKCPILTYSYFPFSLGSCSLDSKSLSERTLNFLKTHTLKDAAVDSTQTDPLLVRASMQERLTVIAVDPQVPTSDGEKYDVLFVGTTRGRVIKFISVRDGLTTKPVVIEEMQVFPYHVQVTNIKVSGRKIIVLSDHEVKSLPVSRCGAVQVQSCQACVALQDPYCAWSVKNSRCGGIRGQEDVGSVAQDVRSGKHVACEGAAGVSGKILTTSIEALEFGFNTVNSNIFRLIASVISASCRHEQPCQG